MTIDGVGLKPSITHEEGLRALGEVLDKKDEKAGRIIEKGRVCT